MSKSKYDGSIIFCLDDENQVVKYYGSFADTRTRHKIVSKPRKYRVTIHIRDNLGQSSVTELTFAPAKIGLGELREHIKEYTVNELKSLPTYSYIMLDKSYVKICLDNSN